MRVLANIRYGVDHKLAVDAGEETTTIIEEHSKGPRARSEDEYGLRSILGQLIIWLRRRT